MLMLILNRKESNACTFYYHVNQKHILTIIIQRLDFNHKSGRSYFKICHQFHPHITGAWKHHSHTSRTTATPQDPINGIGTFPNAEHIQPFLCFKVQHWYHHLEMKRRMYEPDTVQMVGVESRIVGWRQHVDVAHRQIQQCGRIPVVAEAARGT